MKDMTYRLLDSTLILRRCLHNGPVPFIETSPDDKTPVDVESQINVAPGTVGAFLKVLENTYGAYGYAVIDENMIVGQVRFFPTELAGMPNSTTGDMHLNTCIQERQQQQIMAKIGSADHPANRVTCNAV